MKNNMSTAFSDVLVWSNTILQQKHVHTVDLGEEKFSVLQRTFLDWLALVISRKIIGGTGSTFSSSAAHFHSAKHVPENNEL